MILKEVISLKSQTVVFIFANFLLSDINQAIGQTFQNGWTISIKGPQQIFIWRQPA